MLHSTLKNCNQLVKLDLTNFYVGDDYSMGLAKLAGVEPKFKQLDARIQAQYSHEIDLIVHLVNNAPDLATINIDRIDKEEFMDRLIAAGISLSEKVQHNVELNLKWCRSTREENKDKVPKELPTNKPDNLKIVVNYSDE